MKNFMLAGGCFGVFMCGVGCTKNTVTPTQSTTPKSFTIYSAMQFQDMPSLSSIGLQGFNLINETSLFTSSTDLTPDTNKVAALAAAAASQPGVPACLDIEKWSYSNSQLPTTIDWFLQVISVFKEYDTSGLGFYGVVPNDAYSWPNIEPVGGTNYLNWQALNTALTPLADQVNMFFPSFYTDDDDTASWRQFVTSTLSELHKYNVNKPVYAFLWPQYHDGEPNQYQFLDTSVWRYELETLYPLVDGLVIWSSSKTDLGVNGIYVWDDTWPWWTTTESFMTEHHIQ
jgi:hypothetical protein